MNVGVVLLNFGEPATPDRAEVTTYLERIFFDNADLERYDTEAEARERARTLAERRAPALIEEYEAIGGSPLQAQAEAQAESLQAELEGRGYDARTYLGYQYTEPLIGDAVEAAFDDGVEHLIGFPVYPLSGPSTNVFAVDDLEAAVRDRDRDVQWNAVTGWHRHPTYPRMRAENVQSFVSQSGLDLQDPDTELLFSAHGTTLHYLEEGSRYDQYVDEYTETMAALLGVDDYTLGFQNHENRDIPWTEPEVEEAIATVDAERVVVEPASFLHEQSETLSELDEELAEEAEAAGLEFYRVPVPHDEPRLPGIMADLVEPFIADFDPRYYQLRQCQCRDEPGTYCLNADL
ncbi:Protoheme ferro-lyase [Halanaeroarchaeum sp. HSR-CO]|uniref:ferrochelatase n=1 Tax=Halanaeroarchaeum sp. HSR-CO TaxID=2866382 RepID=UPI00217D9253|nr:ferrochelatase [Halanaeroarchaeum sp. HSR-CO]UWG47347.1 Protoheme ferro-lyase [Halanaeroarchaeum sp. HSR-CO]